MVDILTPNVDVESLGAKGKESGFMEGDLVDRESESDVEEDDSETSSFMASKRTQMEDQLDFCDAFDTSLRGQIRDLVGHDGVAHTE
ncbi:hypothetical protein Tco_0271330 [Tanacetum coccineum]